jgi:hypothetical protein
VKQSGKEINKFSHGGGHNLLIYIHSYQEKKGINKILSYPPFEECQRPTLVNVFIAGRERHLQRENIEYMRGHLKRIIIVYTRLIKIKPTIIRVAIRQNELRGNFTSMKN